MLALSFLLLIGVMLVAEGFDQHVPKGYVYSAMAFSLFVEMLNLRAGRRDPTPTAARGSAAASEVAARVSRLARLERPVARRSRRGTSSLAGALR